MNIWGIIKSVGSRVVEEVIPGGGLIIDAVNAILPDEKKLPSSATGADLESAVNAMTPEQRTQIEMKKFDVDITQIKESNSTLRTMLSADAVTPHTTRPYIAKGSFHVVAFVIITVISIWAYGVSTNRVEVVKAVMEGWKFILAVIGPLVSLLWAYFGILRKENKTKVETAGGVAPTNIVSTVAGLLRNR